MDNKTIHIDIFPCKFTAENEETLSKNYDKDKLKFWETLKEGYLYFEEHKQLPKVNISKNGDYKFED